MKSNILNEKLTSGLGIAVLVVLGLKLAGFNLEDKIGLGMDNLIMYVALGINGVLLMFAKDPNSTNINK